MPDDLSNVQFSSLEDVSCDCGFKPGPGDAVFGTNEEGRPFFECPNCGEMWVAVAIERQN